MISGKSPGDTLPWWEGSDTDDFEWTSAGVPDDREEHGARLLSQKLFPDRPKKKRKNRERRRAGYGVYHGATRGLMRRAMRKMRTRAR